MWVKLRMACNLLAKNFSLLAHNTIECTLVVWDSEWIRVSWDMSDRCGANETPGEVPTIAAFSVGRPLVLATQKHGRFVPPPAEVRDQRRFVDLVQISH